MHFYHLRKPLPGDNGLVRCYYVFINEHWGLQRHTHLLREQRDRETERQSPFYALQDSVLLTVHGLVFNSPPPSRAVPP